MPISIRSLEAIIRLSTAYAKLRLSDLVEIQDCVNGLKMFMKSFYSGYEKISEKFFDNYKEQLKMGRS